MRPGPKGPAGGRKAGGQIAPPVVKPPLAGRGRRESSSCAAYRRTPPTDPLPSSLSSLSLPFARPLPFARLTAGVRPLRRVWTPPTDPLTSAKGHLHVSQGVHRYATHRELTSESTQRPPSDVSSRQSRGPSVRDTTAPTEPIGRKLASVKGTRTGRGRPVRVRPTVRPGPRLLGQMGQRRREPGAARPETRTDSDRTTRSCSDVVRGGWPAPDGQGCGDGPWRGRASGQSRPGGPGPGGGLAGRRAGSDLEGGGVLREEAEEALGLRVHRSLSLSLSLSCLSLLSRSLSIRVTARSE